MLQLVTHFQSPVRKWLSPKNTKSQISRKRCVGRKKYVHQFCAARREESNGLYSRSIRPLVLELWPKMSIWPLTSGDLLDRKWNSKTRHMGGKHFASCTFCFFVNRPSCFPDMTDQSFWPFDLWWPWPLTLTFKNDSRVSYSVDTSKHQIWWL